MSRRELERVEVMSRVAQGDLGLQHAAEMLGLSYRQTKRVWRRYRECGGESLKHGNAGRESNRGKPRKLRRRVLSLIQRKYSGSEGERFGPTLAAEHLAEEDGIGIDHETLRRWPLAAGSRVVEPATPTPETLPAAGAQAALWRTSAAGWKFS
jgi:transposase